MSDKSEHLAWDGRPIAPDPPFGATVVVYRVHQGKLQFLLLHRAHQGPNFEGDWAWTPPSGARFPGEAVEVCAKRELQEETGLDLELVPIQCDQRDWFIYAACAEDGAGIRLSQEHDRYHWAEFQESVHICRPEPVARALSDTAHELGLL